MNAPSHPESTALAVADRQQFDLSPRISGGCIEFVGKKRGNGYGYTQFMGRQYLAHRLAYALNQYMHPDALRGVVIRHACDNRSCINVEHLAEGTIQDNTDDKIQRGRHPHGEMCSYSKLSAEDVAAIRRDFIPRDPTYGQRAMARRYRVSQSTISLAISGKNWARLQSEINQ